jgi:rhodanese-related sulfurtransferase
MNQHRLVTPAALRAMLTDGGELALLDLREELTFSESHLLFARSLPLSRLELGMARLVPRLSTRIVLCDGGEGAHEGLAARGAAVLQRHGYSDVAVLDGGIDGWARAGFELFSGVNVPSKAFGELVEHASHTPSVSAEELNALMREGADMVVLDSRPFDEFNRISIPTGIDTPGAELVLRVKDLAPSPQTLVVVNCAGRTRSIIGAQSLINAGVPNKVVALRNGTMGWSLAGFACGHGETRRAPEPSADALAWAAAAAGEVAQRLGIATIDEATLARFRADAEQRSLYLLDVRDPSEYAAGHVAGAVSAPGGQLVQATDQYVGTLGARLVLIDDKGVRALMTASWLRQMGWRDVHVFTGRGDETGWPQAPMLGDPPRSSSLLDARELADMLARRQATVIDLSLSRTYRSAHIPGAWFAIRARLAQAIGRIPLAGALVLTSEDGRLAGLAAPEAEPLTAGPVRVLDGGNEGWKGAGQPLTADDPRMADEAIDAWLKPYERTGDTKKAAEEYLSWEVDLLPRIARDGTTSFMPFSP